MMVPFGQLLPRCCRTMSGTDMREGRDVREGRDGTEDATDSGHRDWGASLGLSQAYPRPHSRPTYSPVTRQETALRLAYAGAFRLRHVWCPHSGQVSPSWGMARWTSPANERQANSQSGAPRQKTFLACRYRKRASQAVKRTKCNPLAEPTDWGKRAPNCGCASCARCPRGTSGTFLRRYTKCAAIFSATGGCRHRS